MFSRPLASSCVAVCFCQPGAWQCAHVTALAQRTPALVRGLCLVPQHWSRQLVQHSRASCRCLTPRALMQLCVTGIQLVYGGTYPRPLADGCMCLVSKCACCRYILNVTQTLTTPGNLGCQAAVKFCLSCTLPVLNNCWHSVRTRVACSYPRIPYLLTSFTPTHSLQSAPLARTCNTCVRVSHAHHPVFFVGIAFVSSCV